MRHKSEPCDSQLKVWLPQSLHDKIEIAAAHEGRSIAGMTRRILQAWSAEAEHTESAA
jgi:plasmid stability protein